VVLRLREQSLDEVPIGVVRLSLDKRVTYLNKALRETLGAQIDIGTRLEDIALDKEDRNILAGAMYRRFTMQQGESYRIKARRANSDTSLYLEIVALPEYDAAGALAGAIGLVRNVTAETISAAIHADIQSASNSEDLLRAVSVRLRNVIHFDSLRVTLVSDRETHLRTFFEHADQPLGDQGIRWWPMQDFVKLMIKSMVPGSVNLDELLSAPEFEEMKRSDESMKGYLKLGYKYMCRLPVSSKGKVRAIVALEKREDRTFADDEVACFLELPIVEVVNMALALDRHKETRFAYKLSRKLGKVADSVSELGKTLVTRLQENYKWEHVSLFRVDEENGKLHMVCQAPPGGLRDDYSQDISVGMLGSVATTGKARNIGNVLDKQQAPDYIVGMPGTKSEMCVPIPGAGPSWRVGWILNLESTKKDAFADEEQELVERLLGVVGIMFDRIASNQLKAAMFESSVDAMIVTNADNRVLQLNPAAEHLLGRKLADFGDQHVRFSDLVRAEQDDDLAAEDLDQDEPSWNSPPTGKTAIDSLAYSVRAPSSEYRIVRPDGTSARVLISAATLPSGLGKIYIANDLRDHDRTELMKAVSGAFEQVARELRMPIGLAHAFLMDAINNKEASPELMRKALKHLSGADLPLQRLVRLASEDRRSPLQCGPVSIQPFLKELIDELPGSGAVSLAPGSAPDITAIAARPELKFCMQSIIAYLMRRRAQNEIVLVRLSRATGEPMALASVQLLARETRQPIASIDSRTADERMPDFALAESAIERLIKRMGGRYTRKAGARTDFSIALRLEEAAQ
jgi:PAS domain-containing protein